MFSLHQMPSQIEQVTDSSMSTQEPLRLTDRFKSPHPPLSHPDRLMRLLSQIILIMFSTVDCLRDQFPVSNTIAWQFVGDYLPGLATIRT